MILVSAAPATRIVFDLDGTLVQTRVSSWEVFREVQAEFGLGIDTAEAFFSHFEGNFFASVRAHCADEKIADAVVSRFFERLERDYRPDLVPGMADVIHALAPGATLAVLSSNATSVIRRVLDEHGLQFCFAHVFGGDVEPDKTRGLQRFLADAAQGVGRRCAPAFDEGAASPRATAADTVLVTDTVGDAEAARAVGVRVVGVSWGMHSPERLREAGAEFVAVWPQELVAYLRTPGGPVACEVPGAETAIESAPADAPPGRQAIPADPRQVPAVVRRSRRLAAVRAPGGASGRVPPPSLSSGGCGCDPTASVPEPRAVELASPAPAPSGPLPPRVPLAGLRDAMAVIVARTR